MEEKVTKLLHAHGYPSVKELEEKIEQVLARDELKKWKDMTKEYRIPILILEPVHWTDPRHHRLSRDHGIQSWILAISGLATLATGVVIGGLVLFGVIAGAAGIAAIGVIAPILAALAIFGLVWGAISGAQERAVGFPFTTAHPPSLADQSMLMEENGHVGAERGHQKAGLQSCGGKAAAAETEGVLGLDE